MIAERTHRSIHVETILAPEEVRSFFGRCGEVRGVYAAGVAEDSLRARYFVEYRDTRAVENACALQLSGTTVHPLEPCTELAGYFQAVVSPDLPQKPHAEVIQTARWSPYGRNTSKNQKKTRQAHQASKDKIRPPSTYTVLGAEPITKLSYLKYPPPASPVRGQRDRFNKENQSYLGPPIGWHDRLLDTTAAVEGSAGFVPAYIHDSSSFPSSLSAFTEPSSSSSGLGTGMFSSRMLLDCDPSPFPLYGDPIEVCLDSLGDSPEEIISILKTAASDPAECGKWVVVGAHYRSRGNVEAAIAVISTMIEVMLAIGMSMPQLRPAVLMLSSCHLDLARQLRAQSGVETAASKSHLDKACEGFRKVYGAYEPPPPYASVDSHSAASGPVPEQASMLSDASANTATKANVNSSTDSRPELSISTKAISMPRPKPADPSTPKPALRSPISTPPIAVPSPTGPRHGQLKMLEREIQALRDKQQKQHDSLERARSAKRKLEDELDREQHRRRKLENQLDKTEKAAAGAQRGEEFALEQCRAEVETRRRAEDRVEELKAQIVTIEPKVTEYEERERKTREYFGKLGVTFLKAARGEMLDLPTMMRM
ncbi:hypothetical protein L227DRAFT_572279 [Lentinus tigrinus ALCF2SS1-6]|uniref:RRM domain-containing protein n=1 Tax=Lentinus tigrinus ALCF2SS1-6 TaxID=1328759 RepID=A0A5C2SJ68_9APHY|nr:hypothetical protein L227DRAFT_572279 [Lentinus tigrinus ALCF2SS1-6]